MERFEFYVQDLFSQKKPELIKKFRKIYKLRNAIFHKSKIDIIGNPDVADISGLSEFFLRFELDRLI